MSRSAEELLDALERAGAGLEQVEGTWRLRGSKVPAELLAAVKAQRAEVTAAWERRQTEGRDRYGKPPPDDAPMGAQRLVFPAAWKAQVTAHVLRQPRVLHAWVMRRAERYFEAGVPADDCDWRAAVDAIAWQRNTDARAGAAFVTGLAEVPEKPAGNDA